MIIYLLVLSQIQIIMMLLIIKQIDNFLTHRLL